MMKIDLVYYALYSQIHENKNFIGVHRHSIHNNLFWSSRGAEKGKVFGNPWSFYLSIWKTSVGSKW